MDLKKRLHILKKYYGDTRGIGHTALLKHGFMNYGKDKLVLTFDKDQGLYFGAKLSEIITWNHLEKLTRHNKPLIIDNSVMYCMLGEIINYINELEAK